MRQNLNFLHKWLIEQAARSTKQPFSQNRPPTSASFQIRDRGFALPLAVGMGLIMILVGMTMIARSQNDQVTASAQKATTRGLSATETGITRYQSFLNNFRPLATYDHEDWDSLSADITGVCSTSEAEAVEDAADTTDWKDINDGQYKLVKYDYEPTEGVAPGTGTLTIEGRVNQSNQAGMATSKLQVVVPVQETNPNTIPFPGLWVAGGSIPPNNEIDGDLLVSGCSADIGGDVTRSRTAIPTLEFPDLPVRPSETTLASEASSGDTSIIVNSADLLELVPGQPGQKLILGTDENTVMTVSDTYSGGNTIPLASALSFSGSPKPASTTSVRSANDLRGRTIQTTTNPIKDYVTSGTLTAKESGLEFPSPIVGQNYKTENGIKVYKYRVDAINLENNVTILTDSTTKVIFYVKGNIDTGSNEIIHNNPTNPNYFQIYAYGNNGINHTLTSPDTSLEPHICMKGSGATYGFLFAPDYNIGIAGSGGDAGFIGSVWARQWNPSSNPRISGCGSETSNSVVTQEITDWNALGLTPKKIPPTLAPITTWQRQEVTP